jgi:phage baseplate assembly protein W
VFTPNYLTRDAVKNNLINYLLTNPGERIQNPTFGAGLRKYIFTQIESGNFEFIKDDLQNKINNNFNNIQIDDILVFENENENTINIQIDYNIPNTGINDTLELNFS